MILYILYIIVIATGKDLFCTKFRKYDEEHIILFEAVTWEVTGIGEAIGFTHPPGGFDYKNRSILSFHHSVQVGSTPKLPLEEERKLDSIMNNFRNKLLQMKSSLILNGKKFRDLAWLDL